jgi:hypothetical protein
MSLAGFSRYGGSRSLKAQLVQWVGAIERKHGRVASR